MLLKIKTTDYLYQTDTGLNCARPWMSKGRQDAWEPALFPKLCFQLRQEG